MYIYLLYIISFLIYRHISFLTYRYIGYVSNLIYRNGRKNNERIAPQQSINNNVDRVTLINTANQLSMLRC